jgi:VCBS repeat-containing protein
MINFFWFRRQSHARLARDRKRRSTPPSTLPGIEHLEERALLTANLPIGVDDNYFVNTNGTINATTVLINDFDADGDSVDQAIRNTNVQNGTLLLKPDGTFSYTPTIDFHGIDSFTYYAVDSTHDEASANAATVTITVGSANHAPVANAVNFALNEAGSLTSTLSGSDQDGDSLTFSPGATVPAHGSLFINSDGSFTYTPFPTYQGPDAFSFKVNDGSIDSPEATVNLTVNAINHGPGADDKSFFINEDTSLNGTLSGTDIDGDTLSYLPGSVNAVHGHVVIHTNGTFTYTPNVNFAGTDQFTYKVNDGQLDSPDATVTITMTAVNDAPTVVAGHATVIENGNVSNSLSNLGQDVDGDALTYAATVLPSHGMLALSPDGMFTYTPTMGYSGPDSFKFKANDSQTNSNMATFSLTVTALNVPLTLSLSDNGVEVARNRSKVLVASTASVADPDTVVNYAGAQIQASIIDGGLPIDASKSRVTLTVATQGKGSGLVQVKGMKIFFDGEKAAIATVTGGKKGQALTITFNSNATEQSVNAVLKRVSVQAIKSASTGVRTIRLQIQAGGQTAQGTTTANIV